MKKKRNKNSKSFLSVWLVNLVFNLEWTIPAWIALVLHFFLDISVLWFVAAITLWVIGVGVKTVVVFWLVRVGNQPDAPKKNKNPYSASNYIFRGGNDNAGD